MCYSGDDDNEDGDDDDDDDNDDGDRKEEQWPKWRPGDLRQRDRSVRAPSYPTIHFMWPLVSYIFCSFMFCISLFFICIFCGTVHCHCYLHWCIFFLNRFLYFFVQKRKCLLVSDRPLHVTNTQLYFRQWDIPRSFSHVNITWLKLLVLTDRLGC